MKQWLKSIVLVNDPEYFAAKRADRFSKRFLELIRNIGVVCTFQYVATKSSSSWMWVIPTLSQIILIFPLYQLLLNYDIRIFPHRGFTKLANVLADFVAIGSVYMAVSIVTSKIVDEVVRAQYGETVNVMPNIKNEDASALYSWYLNRRLMRLPEIYY